MREGQRDIPSTPQAIANFLDEFRVLVLDPFYRHAWNRDRIEYVLMEALDNAHEHGNRGREDRRITISWRLGPSSLGISVADEGEGFHPRGPAAASTGWNPRGRGVLSIREYADQVRYNPKGNKVTLSFKRENIMAEINIIEGRVCIVKAESGGPFKDIIESFKNALVEISDEASSNSCGLDTSLFIDFSPLNVVSSSLIGMLGSLIMEDNIQLVCLCGVQPMVRDLFKRFGLITEDGQPPAGATPEIQANFGKIMLCDTIGEGLARLCP